MGTLREHYVRLSNAVSNEIELMKRDGHLNKDLASFDVATAMSAYENANYDLLKVVEKLEPEAEVEQDEKE